MVFIILGLALLVGALRILKIELAYRAQIKVANAIYFYSVDAMKRGETPKVKLCEMEPFRKTVRRMRGGYKRILPYEKYKLIEPYIGMYVEENDG